VARPTYGCCRGRPGGRPTNKEAARAAPIAGGEGRPLLVINWERCSKSQGANPCSGDRHKPAISFHTGRDGQSNQHPEVDTKFINSGATWSSPAIELQEGLNGFAGECLGLPMARTLIGHVIGHHRGWCSGMAGEMGEGVGGGRPSVWNLSRPPCRYLRESQGTLSLNTLTKRRWGPRIAL
jgi:hypothetical protein